MSARAQSGAMNWWLAPRQGEASPVARWLNWLLVVAALAGLFTFAFHQLHYGWNWEAVWRYRAKFLQGWGITVVLSLAALVVSTAVGLLAALGRQSRMLALRALATLYVELVRGTPLLVQILVAFYVVADAFGLQNRYVVGVLALALFTGAYLCEIFRAGLASVGRTQWDAARAVGFSPQQIYRYVVFPQAWRQVLPPMAGQFASLIKDSSLLSVIALNELTLNVQEINANVFGSLEGYLLLAIAYLLLTLPISLWARHLERRAHYET